MERNCFVSAINSYGKLTWEKQSLWNFRDYSSEFLFEEREKKGKGRKNRDLTWCWKYGRAKYFIGVTGHKSVEFQLNSVYPLIVATFQTHKMLCSFCFKFMGLDVVHNLYQTKLIVIKKFEKIQRLHSSKGP